MRLWIPRRVTEFTECGGGLTKYAYSCWLPCANSVPLLPLLCTDRFKNTSVFAFSRATLYNLISIGGHCRRANVAGRSRRAKDYLGHWHHTVRAEGKFASLFLPASALYGHAFARDEIIWSTLSETNTIRFWCVKTNAVCPGWRAYSLIEIAHVPEFLQRANLDICTTMSHTPMPTADEHAQGPNWTAGFGPFKNYVTHRESVKCFAAI